MLAHKFDVDTSRFAFNRETRALNLTIQPVVPAYDEAAILLYGWGLMAGCPQLRRLVVDIEIDSIDMPLDAAAH